MKYKSFLIGLSLVLLSVSMVNTAYSAELSDTQAVNSLMQFLEKSDLIVLDITEFKINSDPYYIIITKEGEFYVNTGNSQVELAIFFQNMDNNTDISIPIDEAYSISENFLAQYYTPLPVENLKLTDAYLEQHGDAGSEYTFIWREVIEDVTTPNYAIISLNPNTGNIIGYIGIYRTITIPIDNDPTINKEDAIEISKEVVDEVSVSSIIPELKIIIDQNDSQKEIWEVCIEGISKKPSMSYFNVNTNEVVYSYEPVKYIVKIDTDNGKILDILKVW